MTVDDLADATLRLRTRAGSFVVGVTGSVAVGKSTLARALAVRLAATGAGVDLVATDGFLLPNAVLDARGLTLKKGFPESYDLAALSAALTAVRAGPARFPAYSHVTYDVDPAGARWLDRPDILVMEGLALGLDRPPAPGLVDCLVYLEAEERFLEDWYVARFMAFWDGAAGDPTSFYARFRSLDRPGAVALAKEVWRGINLPNLRAHIAPVRAVADIVVAKDAKHGIIDIMRQLAEGPGP